MSGSKRGDRHHVLPLEVIDGDGRVLDTIYVGEITGVTQPIRTARPSTDPTTRRQPT